MAERTNMLQGNQEPLLAEESLEIAKLSGDKIAKELVANDGKNPTLFHTPAMADLTNMLQGNQEPLHAEETRTDYACEAKNGKKQGPASPEPSRNVTTNKKMNDRVKKGKQSNAEGCVAVCARMEKIRARGKPPPKRGDVTKTIVREMVVEVAAGVKKVIDTGKAFCCAPEPFDVDAFVEDLPSPNRSEPTATVWDKVEL